MKTIAPRAFNTLTIDATAGTITKRSKNIDKFVDEIRYISLIPQDISLFFPRVIESSTDASDPFITMEYYGYPTLAELYVRENLDVAAWYSIFSHLDSVLVNSFGSYRAEVSGEDVKEMYVGKLHKRLQSMRSMEYLRKIVDVDTVTLNGRRLDNLPVLWDSIESEVVKMSNNVVGSLIHGDFCFSNILYDVDSHICRFIDPRGSFGSLSPSAAGDLRYDIAKLWHSVDGMYDFITADKFTLSVDSDASVEMTIASGAKSLAISDVFSDVFFSTWNRREIEIICGLMLCSIPALHYDHPKRQVAIYVRGLQLLNGGLNS